MQRPQCVSESIVRQLAYIFVPFNKYMIRNKICRKGHFSAEFILAKTGLKKDIFR